MANIKQSGTMARFQPVNTNAIDIKKSSVTNFGPRVRFEDHLDHYLIEKMAKMPIFGHTVFKENHLNRDTNESFHHFLFKTWSKWPENPTKCIRVCTQDY